LAKSKSIPSTRKLDQLVRLCQDLSCKSLLAMPRPLISFSIQSTFDILSLCTLCKTPSATVSHILSGCKVALKQGRYTYRYDNILADIVKCLQDFLATHNSPSLPSEDDTINFGWW